MSYLDTTGADAILDPRKRVLYSTGLVLGVDELNQEQYYHQTQLRGHSRLLHGYGTVSGLKVRIQDADGAPEVIVETGTAVSPLGETLHVAQPQCARIQEWLERHANEALAEVGSPPGDLTVSVVLRLRECETDLVPIPGEACRGEAESSVASRVAEDFELALTLAAPVQSEEIAIQQLGDLLRSLEVSDIGPFLIVDEVEDLVRELADGAVPTPAAPVPTGSTHLMLRAAQRVWITEVRPAILAQEPEDSVLLAQLTVPVALAGESLAIDGTVSVDESSRPCLLPTRLVQEQLRLGSVFTSSLLAGDFSTGGSAVETEQAAAPQPYGVDVNTAGAAELEELPGIGPSLARRVVERRQSGGPFETPEDLLEVSGIGRQLLERIADRLVIRRRGGRKA